MALNLFNFAIGTVLAERQGVTDSAARTRVALIGSLLDSTATGLVITTVLARREAESIPPASTPTTPTPPTLVEVPDVKGLSGTEAKKILADRGLSVQQQDIISDDPKGEVIDQIPAANTFVAVGSTVTLRISLGSTVPATQVLPNVINQPLATAKPQLEALGLMIKTYTVLSDDAEPNQVIMQNPDPGSAIAPGDTITLLVSPDSEQVMVPDLVGKASEVAQSILKEQQFDIAVKEQIISTREHNGQVIEQQPVAKTPVPPGSLVTLIVGRFLEPVK